MKKYLTSLLTTLARPLLGKGIIDSHFPFAIRLYERIYAATQTETVQEVAIPLKKRLQVFTRDIGVGFPLLTTGKYEPLQTNLFLEYLHPGTTVLDVGANVGYYTVLASEKVGPKGVVFSFEPDPENFQLLKENLHLNSCKNVQAEQKAVTNQDAEIEFTIEATNKGESAVASENSKGKRYRIPGVRIDTFLPLQKVKKLDVIKIDIEGAEIQALQGMKQTIATSNSLTLFIEYNPSRIKLYGSKPDDLLKLLEGLGFTLKTIIDETRSLKLPYSDENLAKTMRHTTYCNLICAKEST